jgi:cytoskeletal protein CcmA (bactofilin family)
MPSPSRATLLALAVGVLVLGGASPAIAAKTSNSDIVLIREGEVVEEDLYAGAIAVRVVGEIDGDLVAFAAERVVIEGVVTGSVTVVAPIVAVSGTVGGSLRAVSRTLEVTGSIAGDVVAVGSDLSLGPDSRVGGDVLAWALSMSALGVVEADLNGSQRSLELAGRVDGHIDVAVGSLVIVDDLLVGGDLGYRSGREATGLDRVTANGAVVHKTPLPPNLRVRGLILYARLVSVIFLAISAVTIVWGWPDRTRAAAGRVAETSWKNWTYGAALFASPLVVVAITGVVLGLAPPAAALPFLALVVPLTLAMLGLLLVVALGAGVPVSAYVGRRLFKGLGLPGAVIAGSLVLGAVWMLPYVGWLVPLIALPLGLGAWLRSRRETAVAQPSVD